MRRQADDGYMAAVARINPRVAVRKDKNIAILLSFDQRQTVMVSGLGKNSPPKNWGRSKRMPQAGNLGV
jgi:hypothetical protein